ncbi:MAG: ABC transporter substrate-binding protein [Methylophilaceae bacterium]|nr:ABC transporter substrate-binding protein [Methylophilaceae bacterium]
MAPLLPACAGLTHPITIAAHVWPGYAPLYLAQSLGWLNPTWVRLVKDSSATESMALLRQGRVDAAALTLDEVLRMREAGVPLAVILIYDISAGADMLLARPYVTSLADLKGRRIAVEESAVGVLMLHHVLEAAGLSRDEIEVVPLPPAQQVAAWQENRIEAAITYEPASSRMKALGAVRLFDSSRIPDTIFDVLAVHDDVLDVRHGRALRHLVATHFKALHHLQTNPEDATYRLAPDFHLPPDQVLDSFRGMLLPDLDNNRRLLTGQPPALLTAALKVGTVMQKAGLLERPPALDGLIRADYLPREAA